MLARLLPIICFLCLSLDASAKSVKALVTATQTHESQVINEILLTGTVSTPRSSELSSELSGLIKSLKIEEGQRVNQGDAIVELDSELQQLSLDAAKAKTSQLQLELADAKRRLADARRLAKQKTISNNDVQSLLAEVNIDNAALKRSLAEQQQQESRLSRHQIYAPFKGVISHKFKEQGEWITPGDAIVRLISTENLRIDFKVPQAAFPQINLNTPISIKLETHPGKDFTGQLIAIIPVTESQSRTFLIRAVINASDDNLLMPGMSANGLLKLGSGRTAVVIARDAVLRQPDGRSIVWLINKDNTVSEKTVTTGVSFNGLIEITSGLDKAQQIVLKGNESLRDGQMISIQQD